MSDRLDMSDRIALLLCAGYGTRMGPLTSTIPKPLLPVAGKPILDYLVDQLSSLDGLAEIHVVSNARYVEAFRAWAAEQRRQIGPRGPDLKVHDDGSTTNADRLGAIGDLEFVLERVGRPRGALIAAGDNIMRFALEPLWRAFISGEHSYVLGLEEREPEKLRRTGVLELRPDGRVQRLHEKPDDPPSTWACPSLYCLQGSALERVGSYLAAGHSRDEIGRFIAYLVPREPIYAYRTAGERLHVGSPEAYRRAEEILAGV